MSLSEAVTRRTAVDIVEPVAVVGDVEVASIFGWSEISKSSFMAK